MKFTKGSLFAHIRNYLTDYLPKQRRVSPNTIRSYSKALELLIDFVKDRKQISLADVTFEMLTAEMICLFLDYIEDECRCSVKTRNNRLAAIRVFIEYAAGIDISVVVFAKEIKKVPVKKLNQIETVNYMSIAAITALIEQPDVTTEKGLRDRFFMILMYDTGARIQEMIDIKLCDLRVSKTSTIILHGKGNKIRSVPLMEKTVQHLQKYLSVFHSEYMNGIEPLFYAVTNNHRNPLSASCIRQFLNKYGQSARKLCPEIPENVRAHLWRHSRAMHLYQQGMDLTLVSQWLGHAQLETTQIYAYADTEHKRKAIAAATPMDNPLSKKLNPARFTITDDEIIKRLTGLH